MTCIRYPDDDLVMRYVTGDLTEPDQSTFEDHLFACDTCLARVERYQAAQQALAARELPAPTTRVAAPSDRPARRAAWWMLAAAAVLLVAIAAAGSWWGTRNADSSRLAARSTPTSEPAVSATAPGRIGDATSTPGTSRSLQLAVLAMVTPPPYLPLTTRGDDDVSRVATGLAAYTKQDWSAAADALDGAEAPAARFYGGIANLMRGDPAAATSHLQAVRESGTPPYASESAFYLGKAALQRGDVGQALTWFETARAEGSTTAREAARLITALGDLQGR